MSNKEKSTTIKRRAVLKGILGTGAAVSMTPLALNLTARDAHAAPRALPQQWDETVDVLIIGSGFAGLAAATEAAAAGATTLILEKMPSYGGNSIINGGVYASWDDELHLREKLKLGQDSPEQHASDTMKGGDYYSNPELVKILAEGATPALNWMMDEGGCTVRPALTRAGGHTAYRTHTVTEHVGRGYTEPLKKMALAKGATIRLGTEVTWIWRESTDGPVLGVEVKKGRRVSNIKAAKALILASGGFSRDIKMRQEYNPAVVPEINCTNHPGATGR